MVEGQLRGGGYSHLHQPTVPAQHPQVVWFRLPWEAKVQKRGPARGRPKSQRQSGSPGPPRHGGLTADSGCSLGALALPRPVSENTEVPAAGLAGCLPPLPRLTLAQLGKLPPVSSPPLYPTRALSIPAQGGLPLPARQLLKADPFLVPAFLHTGSPLPPALPESLAVPSLQMTEPLASSQPSQPLRNWHGVQSWNERALAALPSSASFTRRKLRPRATQVLRVAPDHLVRRRSGVPRAREEMQAV